MPLPHNNPNHHRFSHCPSCGEPDLAPACGKSFACSACGFSFFMNCAAAAMALILDEKKRLLVTIRKHDPAAGSYDFPGGFAEPGEGIEQCLTREIKEELNLEVDQLSYLCSFANTYPYKSVVYPITDMAFSCRIKSFRSIKAGDDVAGFEFIRPAEIKPSLFGMASAQRVFSFFKKLYDF